MQGHFRLKTNIIPFKMIFALELLLWHLEFGSVTCSISQNRTTSSSNKMPPRCGKRSFAMNDECSRTCCPPPDNIQPRWVFNWIWSTHSNSKNKLAPISRSMRCDTKMKGSARCTFDGIFHESVPSAWIGCGSVILEVMMAWMLFVKFDIRDFTTSSTEYPFVKEL